ncbi:hypothetical protein YC2023_031139 [Brassica napus]
MEMLLVFCYVYLVTQRADELSDTYQNFRICALSKTKSSWTALPHDRIPHMHRIALEDDGVVFCFAYSDVHNVVDSVTVDQMSVTNSAAKLVRLREPATTRFLSTLHDQLHESCFVLPDLK